MRISDWSSDVCSSDLVILVDHPQSRRADRVAEAFQPAVDLAWDGAVGVVKAVEHVAPAFAFLGDVQILHRHQLGDRETVMHLDQAQLRARNGEDRKSVVSGKSV